MEAKIDQQKESAIKRENLLQEELKTLQVTLWLVLYEKDWTKGCKHKHLCVTSIQNFGCSLQVAKKINTSKGYHLESAINNFLLIKKNYLLSFNDNFEICNVLFSAWNKFYITCILFPLRERALFFEGGGMGNFLAHAIVFTFRLCMSFLLLGNSLSKNFF